MVLGQIQGYIKSRLNYARLVLGLFSHILHNVRHTETFAHIQVYFGRFRHIQKPGTVRHIHVC